MEFGNLFKDSTEIPFRSYISVYYEEFQLFLVSGMKIGGKKRKYETKWISGRSTQQNKSKYENVKQTDL